MNRMQLVDAIDDIRRGLPNDQDWELADLVRELDDTHSSFRWINDAARRLAYDRYPYTLPQAVVARVRAAVDQHTEADDDAAGFGDEDGLD